jgi:hypothetical protein
MGGTARTELTATGRPDWIHELEEFFFVTG